MENEQETKQSNKQERREVRAQKKEAERRARERQQLIQKIRNYAIVIAIIAAIGYGFYALVKASTPEGEDFSRSIQIMSSTAHIPEDSQLPEYTSNPPTSGPHYGQTARSGFRDDKVIPDQNIIHNLEHGDIWISYHPRVSDEIKEALKSFGGAKVIITPREANDTDIALAAWGRLDTFDIENDTLPTQRIEDFITLYTGRGPEQIPGASGGI